MVAATGTGLTDAATGFTGVVTGLTVAAGDSMTTTVKISETYDLSTKANSIGLLGIHTPPRSLLDVHYGGLAVNHRKVRFLGCDVVLASTATLPLDPLGVGTAAGKVNPADSMNPILYRAVSNDSFETLIARMYGAREIDPSTEGGSVNRVEFLGAHDGSMNPKDFSTYTTTQGDWDVYYGLLSTESGWRKAMPQQGVIMRNLQPLAYPLLMQYGNVNLPQGNDPRQVPGFAITAGSGTPVTYSDTFPNTTNRTVARYFRGSAVRQPAFPLHSDLTGGNASTPTDSSAQNTTLPTTFVAAIIVPPCHTDGVKLYYRLRVTWYISYEEVCSSREYMPLFGGWMTAGKSFHWADYSTDAAKLSDTRLEMVDINGLEAEKVMEGTK